MTKQEFIAKLLKDPAFRNEWRQMTHDQRKRYLMDNVGLSQEEANQLDDYNQRPADDQAVLNEVGTAVETAFWG